MGTYLDRILAAHRAASAGDDRPLAGLVERASAAAPVRPFAAALRGGGELSVVAEVKRRSPSRGDLAPGLVPGVLAKSYADGGAACLSVLTDAEFFAGSATDLDEARSAVDLPVLRKDFTVSERDVCDARIMGADAVLLIVAALERDELTRFHALAAEVGLEALVEVHDEEELSAAFDVGAGLIGVNQRSLATFEIDRDLPARLAPSFPPEVVRVAESGVRHRQDAEELCRLGFDAVLVGESLVTSGDAAGAVRELRVRCS